MRIVLALTVCAVVGGTADLWAAPQRVGPPEKANAVPRRPAGGPSMAQSAHFVVRSSPQLGDPQHIAATCERLRAELQNRWFGEVSDEPWEPPCEVVLHRTRQSYQRAAGGAPSTVGVSAVQVQAGRIALRRIDLLAEDAKRALSALAHELTHVVLADRFLAEAPPRWADEGIALLADSRDKRRLHRRDLARAVGAGAAMRLVEMLQTDYPPAAQWGTFYGQSLSLVEFLLDRGAPPDLVRFIAAAQQVGYDEALRRCYRIDGVAALEKEWRRYAMRP